MYLWLCWNPRSKVASGVPRQLPALSPIKMDQMGRANDHQGRNF